MCIHAQPGRRETRNNSCLVFRVALVAWKHEGRAYACGQQCSNNLQRNDSVYFEAKELDDDLNANEAEDDPNSSLQVLELADENLHDRKQRSQRKDRAHVA
eukprot:scaffold508_cov554-Prasinococcus_capsulatus_cf.AAC.23